MQPDVDARPRSRISLRNAIVAAKTAYTDYDSYAKIDPKGLHGIEPTLTFNASDTAVRSEVSIRDISLDTVVLVTTTPDGHVYCLADDATKGTTYGTRDAMTVDQCSEKKWPIAGEYP